MAKEKIFLLDAFALLYRAHFAFIRAPRITSKGLDTSAVFGFTNSLMEIITKEDPSHLVVVFDTSAPTFRHKQYEPYKAQREAMPEGLRAGIPYVHKLLDALGIHTLALDGYEADDIIGTLSVELDADKYDVYMVTPDKDYAQLVKENVFLYKPAYKGGGFDVMGPDQVVEKFGIPPEKIIDFLGLKGDAVDNIPGIPKIGDKTAVSLINEFGSVEEIVARAEEITKKSIRESVQANGEQGLLSKDLATIKIDVPIEWTMKQLELEHADLETLIPLMHELEFKRAADRILNSKLNPMRKPQLDLFGQPTGDGADSGQMAVDTGLIKSIESVEHDYKLLDTQEKRADLIGRIQKEGQICFDTETTGLDPMIAELVGMSFSLKAGEAYYVPCPEDRAETQKIVDEFKGLLEDEKILKIGQNLKYDLLLMRNYGVVGAGPMFDTMLAHYVLIPEGKHGMDAMSEEMLNYKPVSIEKLIGKKGKKQKSMRDVEVSEIVEYAAEDADITLQLKEKLAPQIKGNKVFEEIEMPVMPVLTAMEYEGINLDEKALNEYSVELGEKLQVLEKDIYEMAGEEFNINSPRQLGTILFEKLELGKGRNAKKTKTGQYQTNEAILVGLAAQHELPATILSYRGLNKLRSTYVDALPQLINPKTGRVHTTFNQSVAVTGRLASSDPNLQNIPIRTPEGREVRKGFIPRNEEFLLLSADYSQVELRIMAALSGDESMIEAFRSGEDIHRASASRVFGIPAEEVTSEQRSRAKTVNFGIIYGISAFGLSQRMGISRTEAKDIIDTYFEKYPKVKAHMDHSIEIARDKGYVETLFGRRRNLPDIRSGNATVRGFAERNAINSPIQGSAADIIKLAMIDVYREMQKGGFKSRLLLQVHDELVFDLHRDEIDDMKALVQRCMTGAAKLDVPLEIEMGTGLNWLEAH